MLALLLVTRLFRHQAPVASCVSQPPLAAYPRLFVLDPLDRLLLFRFRTQTAASWLTPRGLTRRDRPGGSRRELAEETGYG